MGASLSVLLQPQQREANIFPGSRYAGPSALTSQKAGSCCPTVWLSVTESLTVDNTYKQAVLIYF